MASGHKVRIAARLRPGLKGEVAAGDHLVVREDGIDIANPRDKSQIFSFPLTSCYGPHSTQDQIFQADVLPLLDVFFSGVTVTIFAYGVTSSGKTHTMQGTNTDPGVIPRVVSAMFERPPSHRSVQFTMSYMEIYKDDVYDLLSDRDKANKLPVREDGSGKIFVANLSQEPIESAEEFHTIYTRAAKSRAVGSTNLNNQSSRSHAVLTIEVEMSNGGNTSLHGKINLVDLAGSENNKMTGNSDPSRMAESSAINKSLSVLGQVVHALNQGASRIPYRNSKLTRILQDALGGHSVGLLICNLAPAMKFRQDTLNTLNFAVRTKSIENKPVVDERDNRPQVKPHFAAIQPQAPKLAPAMVQPISTTGSSRLSLVPSGRPVGAGSRVPRVSAFGAYQSNSSASSRRGGITLGGDRPRASMDRPRVSIGMGLSEKDIDERIAKAVEAEVARRMAEREREDDARRAASAQEAGPSRYHSPSPKTEHVEAQTSALLTPIMQHHQDMDPDIQDRLEKLERKIDSDQGDKEKRLADALSAAAKKKAGKAYVALARGHWEKGDSQVALDLYRKAAAYVPDNQKLRERILEIEYLVKTGEPGERPSPKPKAKSKKPKKSGNGRRKSMLGPAVGDESHMEVDVPEGFDGQMIKDEPMFEEVVLQPRTTRSSKGKGKASVPPSATASEFGAEVTNSPTKRTLELGEEAADAEERVETPPKKPRTKKASTKKVKVESDNEDDEWVPEPLPAPVKRTSRRKAGMSPEE